MEVIRCLFKLHKGSISEDPGGNWFDKHPFGALAKDSVPCKHPSTTLFPYRPTGSCPAEQAQKLLLAQEVTALHALAGIMTDLRSFGCKTSPPGSLHSREAK